MKRSKQIYELTVPFSSQEELIAFAEMALAKRFAVVWIDGISSVRVNRWGYRAMDKRGKRARLKNILKQ